MGERYHLTTRSRRLKVGEEREEFFLSKYVGSVDTREGAEAMASRADRLRKLWRDRAPPKYVVMGDYIEGSAVYSEWPVFNGVPYIETGPSAPGGGRLAGFLRGDGRAVSFEPWHMYEKEFGSNAELQDAAELLINFMSEEPMVLDSKHGAPKPTLRVFHRDRKLAALIRLTIN